MGSLMSVAISAASKASWTYETRPISDFFDISESLLHSAPSRTAPELETGTVDCLLV